MHQSKLLEILKHCSSRERARLRDFIHSPFFNKNKKLRQFYTYLEAFSPEYSHQALVKETVFAKLFPGACYDESKINNCISELMQLVYEFLGITKFQKDAVLEKELLVKDLLERELPLHVRKASRQHEVVLEKFPFRNQEFYLRAYQFYESQDAFFLSRAERYYDPNLQLKNDQLDYHYMLTKFRIACDMMARSAAVKAEYICTRIDDLVEIYENAPEAFEQIPAIRLHYLAYTMLQKPEADKIYHKFKESLHNSTTLFPKQELWVLYNYLLNYCIRQINSGKSGFYNEIHQIYQHVIAHKIILKNNMLTQWDFKNIVTTGLRIKDFSWTEQFIFDYNKFLPENNRTNAVAYNLAALYYETCAYEKALQQLHNVAFTDASYHLGAKIIQIKSYFHLNETEPLFSLIEAFRKYLLRSRNISDYRKLANNNFLKITRRLYKLKNNFALSKPAVAKKKLAEIAAKIHETNPLANKEWLEKMLSELKEV